MNLIFRTGIASLFIQIATGIFDTYVLTLPVDPKYAVLRNLLALELLVQCIEASFYIWLVFNFANVTNITHYRYYDWVITTPTMLFTYCMYLLYLRPVIIEEASSGEAMNIWSMVLENTPILVPIFILNNLMLLAGYMAEIGNLTHMTGAILGFVPFFAMFYLIYDNYAKFTTVGQMTFWYFSGVWGLYGIASLLRYRYKNAMYNILDLFSKNFFGIFLAMVLYSVRS